MDQLFEMQWTAYDPGIALNPNAAIYKSWLARRRSGDATVGVPLRQEEADPSSSGGRLQLFTGGVATWHPSHGVIWR